MRGRGDKKNQNGGDENACELKNGAVIMMQNEKWSDKLLMI